MNEENNNNKISLSVFREMFKNSARITKILWKEKKGMIIALLFVFLIVSAAPFMQSGSHGLLINELVRIAGSGAITSKLILFIAAVIFTLFIPALLLKIQEYIS